MKKLIITPNGSEVVDMTAEEIAINETNVAENLVKEQELETARQANITDKANGNQKLLDLGLSQAEATALTGYTPTVAE